MYMMDMEGMSKDEKRERLEGAKDMDKDTLRERLSEMDSMPGAVEFRCESEDRWSKTMCSRKDSCFMCQEEARHKEYFPTNMCVNDVIVRCERQYDDEYDSEEREREYDSEEREREEREYDEEEEREREEEDEEREYD